jgi:hypothetical protein
MEPKIFMPGDIGKHNDKLQDTIVRLKKGKMYNDLSTVIIVPTRGGRSLTPRWVQNQQSLMKPMNQKIIGPIYVSGMEVGEAYNWAVQWIMTTFPTFKYMLTWEDDVMPPPDGLIKLYENIEDNACVQGLYYTKGEEGQPMIYGDINDPMINFRPQVPVVNTTQRCYGLGMGFNLFLMDMFKVVPGPEWFKTEQSWSPGVGAKAYTQDLHFYEKGVKLGFKFACDTRIKCGHYDEETDIVW